jgi:hypothetical protein
VTGDLAALQAALAAEHAAIYGYGLLGAHLHGAQQLAAANAWTLHKARRDRLAQLITGLGGQPVAAQPAYELPLQVTSAHTAVQLAAALESTLPDAYIGLAGATDPALRRLAAQSMQDAVTRQIKWNGTAPTTAFPGLTPADLSPKP